MKVRNRYKEVLKTERQWNLEGYKLLETAIGERMWTNQHCQHIATYYKEDEVIPMSKDEKTAWDDEQRKKRNARARELRKQHKEEWLREQEKIRLEEETREREWQEWKAASADKLEELKKTGNHLAWVYIEGYDSFIYEVPGDVKEDEKGIFPFGELDTLLEGTIIRFVDPEYFKDETWFPFRLKKMKEKKE